MYDFCLAAKRSKLVDGMCSVLLYGTGICCYILNYIISTTKICCFCPFLFFNIFLFCFESGVDKSTEWSTIPVCPSLMCFFNGGDT